MSMESEYLYMWVGCSGIVQRDVMIHCCYILSLDDIVVHIILVICFDTCVLFSNSGYPTFTYFCNNTSFHDVLSINTHTKHFSTYRRESMIIKLHVS